MLKLPQSIVFAIIALNITAFTILLQLDWLIFNALWIKLVSWTCSIGAWVLTYQRRRKYFTLF